MAANRSNGAVQQPGEWTHALTDDFLDATIFEQLLEIMDDDEEREFSKQIVWTYFEQVKSSFASMEKAMYLYCQVSNNTRQTKAGF